MNTPPNPNPNPNPDPGLRSLLRAAHPSPNLPPRFGEGVWRRLERSERTSSGSWIETLLAGLFSPKYASLGLAALVVAGVSLGLRPAGSSELRIERDRYLTAVSPLRATP